MSTVYSDSMLENGDSLLTLFVEAIVNQQPITRKLKYVTILPFNHPVFEIQQAGSLDRSGNSTSVTLRKNTEFSLTITGVSDTEKDEIYEVLNDLKLDSPIIGEFQPYNFIHPQLAICNLGKVLIKQITNPQLKCGAMIWKIDCIEYRKPKPVKRLLDPKGGATPKKTPDKPSTQQKTADDRKK